MAQYQLPDTGSISITRTAVDRLIAGRDGGSALAYLCLLRSRGAVGSEQLAQELNCSRQEAERLMNHLAEMGLITPTEEKKEYSADELADALYQQDFSFLVSQAECLFGETLSAGDLQRLLYLQRGLGFSAEVLLQMMQYYKSEVRRVYGPGRRLTMARLEKLAQDWKSRGIATLEDAESFLHRREQYLSQEGEMKRALEIYDRKLTASEQKYLSSWMDMGFGSEALRLCYERTLDRIHSLNFKYMDSIFLSWHKKGLHTPEEIEKGDAPRSFHRQEEKQGAKPVQPAVPDEDETARLKRLLDSMKEG